MKVLITRPRSQADDFAERLRAAGFEPVFFPVIAIRALEENTALEQAIAKLDDYDWVIFTSVNGVDAFFEKMSFVFRQAESEVRFAAIGPRTAHALEVHGVRPDFVPAEYVAEAILPGLGNLQGKRVLLPRAEIARPALPDAIAKAGGIPCEIAVYQTLPAQPESEGLSALRSGVDVITLTSPSTVQNFIAIVEQNGLDPLTLPNDPFFACIGPITEQAAREAGLANIIVANEYTTDGLIDAITHLEKR